MERIVSAMWETKMIVRPSAWNRLIRSRHLRWKFSSPTASTSSTSSTWGSKATATAKPRRAYMPEE
jgi:hypothetical protein